MPSLLKIPTSLKLFNVICRTILNLVKTNVDEFAKYKQYHTLKYVESLLTQLQTATDLPNTKSATANRAKARKELGAAAKQVRANWKGLKGYIKKAFPKNVLTDQYNDAGYAYYKDNQQNWASVHELGVTAIKYIGQNSAQLQANQNMPYTFITTMQDALTAFDRAYATFNDANTAKVTGVKVQADAYHALNEILSGISEDAAVVFSQDSTARKLYALSYQLNVLKRTSAGLKGYIIDSKGSPIEGVAVSSSNGMYSTLTDKKGYFRIDKMAEGDYIFDFEKVGYITNQQPIVLKAGTAKTLRTSLATALQMVPLEEVA